MNYDRQNPNFSILNIDDRRERAVKEKSLYYKHDDSQSHYQYALSKLWYNQWLEFVNSDVKVNKPPPGPIDNSQLEAIIANGTKALRENIDYFFLSKE